MYTAWTTKFWELKRRFGCKSFIVSVFFLACIRRYGQNPETERILEACTKDQKCKTKFDDTFYCWTDTCQRDCIQLEFDKCAQCPIPKQKWSSGKMKLTTKSINGWGISAKLEHICPNCCEDMRYEKVRIAEKKAHEVQKALQKEGKSMEVF